VLRQGVTCHIPALNILQHWIDLLIVLVLVLLATKTRTGGIVMSFSRNSFSSLVPAALGLMIATAATVAFGQAAAPAPAPVLGKPEPIEQNGRFMPGFGSDSLVKVRYTVKADGTTDDVQITGLMANPFLTKMLTQTVSKWTFKPGTLNGKASDYFNQEYLFVIRADPNAAPPPQAPARGSRNPIKEQKPVAGAPGAPGAMPVFDPSQMPVFPLALSTKAKEAIDNAYSLLQSKDNDKALKVLDDVAKKDLHTVYDYGLVNMLRGSAYVASNQPQEALEALQMATINGLTPRGEKQFFLDDKLLEQALRQKFLLAVSLRHNAVAMETYQLLQEKFPSAADDKIHEQAKAVKALMDSADPLALLAKIPAGKEEWTHTLSRRIFTVADLKGKLGKITANCERRSLELQYKENSDWTLPASFGACSLVFAGNEGTQFTVYEFTQ
jgi:hypothetical protein